MICPRCDLGEIRSGTCGWCEYRVEGTWREALDVYPSVAEGLKAALDGTAGPPTHTYTIDTTGWHRMACDCGMETLCRDEVPKSCMHCGKANDRLQ